MDEDLNCITVITGWNLKDCLLIPNIYPIGIEAICVVCSDVGGIPARTQPTPQIYDFQDCESFPAVP